MTRRHHRKLSFNRRQHLPILPSDSETPPSDNTGSTSSSGTAQSNPASGNANTSQKGESGNNEGNSDGFPIGAPQDPNPPPFTPTFVPSSTSSNVVPTIDPSPPKGAQQQPVLSASPSSPSSVVSSASVTPPGLNSGSSSSSASSTISNSPVAIVSPTSSSPTVAVQTPAVLPTSNSLPFNTPNTASASFALQPTITGSLPTQSTTSSAASSSSIGTPAIVGIAAGGLCGLAILSAACLWIGKRVSRYLETKELEPPPMHEPLPDDDAASVILSRRPSGPSSTPRPPTMIERKQANLAGRGNGFYNNGYAPQPGFPQYADPRFANATPGAPGQYYANHAVNASPVQPYFNPIATTSPFDDSAAASMPGTPVYFSRQNSIQSGFATTTPIDNGGSQPQLPNPYDTPIARPNDGYATLNRGPGSVSPQQARQYSDLARQLDFSSTSDRTTSPAPSAAGSYATVPLISNNAGGIPTSPKSPSFKAVPRSPSVVNVSTEVHEGRATPVKFGFNDPSSPTGPAQAISQPTHVQSTHAQPVRPETIYDEEDAYAAI